VIKYKDYNMHIYLFRRHKRKDNKKYHIDLIPQTHILKTKKRKYDISDYPQKKELKTSV